MTEPQRLTAEDLEEIRETLDCDGELWEHQAESLLSHIGYLDAEIEPLKQSMSEARGVAAKLLDDTEAEQPGSGLKWLHDFPWLKECTR